MADYKIGTGEIKNVYMAAEAFIYNLSTLFVLKLSFWKLATP